LGVTNTIVTGIDTRLAGVIDPPDNGAKSGRVPSKDGCSPATAHNEARSASQVKLNTAKIPHGPNVPSTKASKSGRFPDVRIIKTPVNGGTDGMEQLIGLPIEGKENLINLCILTASVFLATKVGELAKKYQVWRKQMAEQNPRSGRTVFAHQSKCTHLHHTNA
jgi:hypothetical protein